MAIVSVTSPVTLDSGDTVIVTQNGTLFTESNDAIGGTFSGSVTMAILGTVASGEFDAIDLNGAASVDITLGASGFVASNADNALEIDAAVFKLLNSGTVHGDGRSVAYTVATGISGLVDIANSGT